MVELVPIRACTAWKPAAVLWVVAPKCVFAGLVDVWFIVTKNVC